MINITLWYDDNTKSNCLYQDAVYSDRTILKKLKSNNINFKLKDTKEKIDTTDVNVYVVELLNVNNNFDIFSLIPDHTKKLFQQGLSLVLYYPKEGHELDDWFMRIHENLVKNKLLGKVYFVFGDNDFESNYNNFLKDNNLEKYLIPMTMDYFAGDYLDKVTDPNLTYSSNKKYNFLFYNGKLRPHRLYAVSELDRYNVLENSLTSLTSTTFTNGTYTLEDCVDVLKQFGADSEHLDSFVKNYKPMILDMPNDSFSQDNINNTITWHYADSYFSIISETSMANRFITEKIYKPIYNYHPFIIIGAPHMLELIKSKGYETFEELFDESYDNEPNHKNRIDMVIKQVVNFCNMSQDDKQSRYDMITDKLIHNRDLYIKTTTDNKQKEFLNIFETIARNKT